MSRIKDNPIVLLPLSFLGMALVIAVLLPGYGILSVLVALIGLAIIMALLHKKNKYHRLFTAGAVSTNRMVVAVEVMERSVW